MQHGRKFGGLTVVNPFIEGGREAFLPRITRRGQRQITVPAKPQGDAPALAITPIIPPSR